MGTERHSAALRALFPVLKVAVWLIFLFFTAPLRAVGKRNVPKDGGLLVISNHISNTDPVVVQYASPRLVHFLARRELFEMGWIGRFIKWWRAVPIKQSSADKGALKSAIELLKAGEAVGIFPEGQLSPDGKLLDLFAGTALIVRRSHAACVCVGLRGSNRLMPDLTTTPRWAFCRVEAVWGQPRTFDHDSTEAEVMGWIESELKRLTGQD